MTRTAPLICALALAGCGGGDQRPAATSTPKPEVRTVTLCSGMLTASFDRLAVRRFNTSHADKGFRARFKRVKGYPLAQVNTLRRRLGRDCDIAQLDAAWMALFAAEGLLSDVTGYLESRRDEFVGATPDTAYYDGRYWGVPRTTDAGLIYARIGAGRPSTWQELYRIARDRKGIVYQGAPYESLTLNFLEIAYAAGGDVLTEDGRGSALDSPENLAALRLMRDGIATGAARSEVTRFTEEEARLAFGDGKATFMRNWPYAYTPLNDPALETVGDFAVLPLPTFRGGKRSGVLTGGNLAVADRAESKEAAMALVGFLTGEEEARRLALDYYLPPALKALYDSGDLGPSIPAYKELREVLEVARPRPATPQWAPVSQAIYTAVHAVLSGRLSPEAALERADERIDRILRS